MAGDYTSAMPSKQPPVSLRPGAKRSALIDAYATDHGLNRHAAILALIDAGLEGGTQPAAGKPTAPPAPVRAKDGPADILARAEAKAAHLAKPKPKNPHSRWNLKSVPLGPTPRPAGSMLKGITPTKGKR